MLEILALMKEGGAQYTLFVLYDDGWWVARGRSRVIFSCIKEAIIEYPSISAYFQNMKWLIPGIPQNNYQFDQQEFIDGMAALERVKKRIKLPLSS
jgi:hypothetical protein